jgi:16S rRNA (adenine1518-N6/adenine1519-N6)-dimethyltransferase
LNSRLLAQKIVDFARIKDETVLEIGAGKGILTKQIARQAKKVFAVEIDNRLATTLERLELPNVVIIENNFLKLTLSNFGNPVLVGNIPYSITTPILEKLVEERDYFTRAVLTVQKEYGERILAHSGTHAYGALTLYIGYYFSTKKGFIIPARFFSPRPQVSSIVISLVQRPAPFTVTNENKFFDFVQGIFRYRRKSLKNALMHHMDSVPEGIDADLLMKRPENLTLEDFYHLYTLYITER